MSSRAARLCSVVPQKHTLYKEMPKPINRLQQDEFATKKKVIHKTRHNVTLQKRDTTLYHNPLLSKPLRSYRQKIKSCTSMDQVHSMLSNLSSIPKYDLSVLCDDFMKQCIKLQQHEECLNILESMYKHHIPRTLASYNILFDGYATYDRTDKAIQIYHEYMLKHDTHLQPNIITANTLLSGCKYKANVDLSKQIWNDIILQHNIKPNIATYIILITIYGRAGLADYCYALFTNMITQEGLRPDTGVCGALMTAYANKGDTVRCNQIIRYMQANAIDITLIECCTLMKCYSFNQEPLHALRVYHDVIVKSISQTELDDKSIKIMANLRMSCYYKLIKEIVDKTDDLTPSDIANVKRFFQMIMQDIPYDVKLQSRWEGHNFYEYLDNNLLQKMLDVLVVMNENSDRLQGEYEAQMLSFLENGFKNNRFGFMHSTKRNVIDLHQFSVNNALLILRYLVSFERKYIEHELNYDLRIMIGRGTHSWFKIRQDLKGNDKQKRIKVSPLYDAILDELSSWRPNIRIDTIDNDSGFVLDADDVKCFFNAHANQPQWFKQRIPK
eukprot:180079_1